MRVLYLLPLTGCEMTVIEKAVKAYHDQGYVVVEDAVDNDKTLDALESAARRVRDKVRSGEVDLSTIRAPTGEPQVIWGLIAPEFDEPVFRGYLISDAVEKYTHAFLGPELRLGWVVLFCTGNSTPYDSTWHRDLAGQEKGSTPEQEMELLTKSKYNTLKWHLALVDDPCLRIVPCSHLRPRTEAEIQILTERPRDNMPGEVTVQAKRGQTIFWNGKTIHRGVSPKGLSERMALHGGMSEYCESDPIEDKVDERFRWRLSSHVREDLPAKMQVYYDRWRALQPE